VTETFDHRKRLIDGYRAFRKTDYPEQKALYEELGTKGQDPKIMLIACCDSRADPSDIFNAYPGEMFVVRNVANIVPPLDKNDGYRGTSAALEFAVNVLGVEAIVVMGHESCGGIQGCLDGLGDKPDGGYVGEWVSLLNNARDRLLSRDLKSEDIVFEMELEGVRQSMKNLMTFPFIKDAVDAGQLSLQGAYFSIIKAKLMLANNDGNFELVQS